MGVSDSMSNTLFKGILRIMKYLLTASYLGTLIPLLALVDASLGEASYLTDSYG